MIALRLMYSGVAPATARSFTVPWTASEPIVPPGKLERLHGEAVGREHHLAVGERQRHGIRIGIEFWIAEMAQEYLRDEFAHEAPTVAVSERDMGVHRRLSSAHREAAAQIGSRVGVRHSDGRSWCCCRRRRLDDLPEGDGSIVRWQRHGQIHAEAGLLEKRLCRIREAPVLEDAAAEAHCEVAAPEPFALRDQEDRARKGIVEVAGALRHAARRVAEHIEKRRPIRSQQAVRVDVQGQTLRRGRRCRDGLELHRSLCLVTRVRDTEHERCRSVE